MSLKEYSIAQQIDEEGVNFISNQWNGKMSKSEYSHTEQYPECLKLKEVATISIGKEVEQGDPHTVLVGVKIVIIPR